MVRDHVSCVNHPQNSVQPARSAQSEHPGTFSFADLTHGLADLLRRPMKRVERIELDSLALSRTRSEAITLIVDVTARRVRNRKIEQGLA